VLRKLPRQTLRRSWAIGGAIEICKPTKISSSPLLCYPTGTSKTPGSSVGPSGSLINLPLEPCGAELCNAQIIKTKVYAEKAIKKAAPYNNSE
jgi:hypothetical protein